MVSDPNSGSPPGNENWNSYWSVSRDAGAFSADGADHPALTSFWCEVFETIKRENPAPRLIDIASGNGAVIAHALSVFAADSGEFTCVDISERAIINIRERFAGVTGIVCDAAGLPLDSGGYDVVTSQFGIEYAGPGAFDEALRLLTPGGYLAALLHHTGSVIYHNCVADLDAVRRVQESQFIPMAIDLFAAGFDAVRGADRAPYEAAASRLNPAVKSLEAIFDKHGQDIAGGAIARLYGDVSRMHQKITQYKRDDVLDWLSQIGDELESYRGRMASMIEAAIDPGSFAQICKKIQQAGFETVQGGPLHTRDTAAPLAWALVVKS